jgi:ABC-type lipoprotein release transport system permease subunit
MVARRYLLPGKGEGFIFLVASISLVAVALGVAALIIVMSVMNGFRAELFDKIVGLNGHAVIQGYGGRLQDWRQILSETNQTDGVTDATALIEQPLLTTFNGRVEAILARGMSVNDVLRNDTLKGKTVAGDLRRLNANADKVAIGSRLAQNLGVQVGQSITIINPAGRTTPFGTVPREISYEVAAIFEVGVYDYDKAFVIMPIERAQILMLMGDEIGMIEIKTDNPDKVNEILLPLLPKLENRGQIVDWKSMNASLFEALAVERVAMSCCGKAFDIAVFGTQRNAGCHSDISGVIATAASADDHVGWCVFADQIKRGGNNIFRRELFEQAFGENILGHARASDGCKRVDADIIFRAFQMQRLGKASQAKLCSAIIGLSEIAVQTR